MKIIPAPCDVSGFLKRPLYLLQFVTSFTLIKISLASGRKASMNNNTEDVENVVLL